jgi:AAA domain
MSALPVEQACRLADRPEATLARRRTVVRAGRWNRWWGTQVLQILPRLGSGGRGRLQHRVPAPLPSRVLLYAAEDALHVVRRRLEGICAAPSCDLKDLDVHVITEPTMRLAQQADRGRLEQTIKQLKPRLLVLDPFVRLHRIDENASGEAAPLRTCAPCNDSTTSPCSWCITPANPPAACAPDRRYAARPSSMPGVTPIFTCVARAGSSISPSNIAPPHRRLIDEDRGSSDKNPLPFPLPLPVLSYTAPEAEREVRLK